ncbi:MAG: EamA family transporter [Burkholderiales bacterium]
MASTWAAALALASSLCFGLALVTSRIGLRYCDARAAAAISVPSATLLFYVAAPFALDGKGFVVQALLLFALVGLFFPALVTLLTFRSNEELGPTITGAVSCTAPLFALLFAGLILGEKIPAHAALACAGIVAGVAVLSWKQHAVRPGFVGRSLLWPIAGAVVRGLAQVGAKAGLLLWPNPFAAGLIGYTMSSATVIGANRLGRAVRPRVTRRGIAWIVFTGVLNGGAVLLMYLALASAPVSLVAPVIATYPLSTALISALVLREEPLTRRMLAGASITVAAVIYLVASNPGA